MKSLVAAVLFVVPCASIAQQAAAVQGAKPVSSRRSIPAQRSVLQLDAPEGMLSDRAHTLALKASSVETHQCEDVSDWETCHNSYPEGCSAAANPQFDPYLGYLKNLLPTPASAEAESVGTLHSLSDFQAFDKQSIAMGLSNKKQVPFASQLADVGQGNIYTAYGYIYYAMVGGIEACNCGLKNPNDRDYHIGLGFDPAVAEQIASGEISFKSSKIPTNLQQNSVIVEMTPHYRGQFHEGWTLSRVQQLQGRQVKVVGQLIIDTEHDLPAQNCAFDNPGANCWRASVWELHPVAEIYVCTTAIACTRDSAAGWVKLDNLVEH